MDSSSTESKRRKSERLFKSLDLASISKLENSKQTSLFDHLASSKNSLVAKISSKINFIKKPQLTPSKISVLTEDDYIVLSSDDETENNEENSIQTKLCEQKITQIDQIASETDACLSSQLVQNDENGNIMESSKKISAHRKSRVSTNSSTETTPKISIELSIEPQNAISPETNILSPILLEEIVEATQIESKSTEQKVTSESKTTESKITSEQGSSESNLTELKVSESNLEPEESKLTEIVSETKSPLNESNPISSNTHPISTANKCIRALKCVMITNEETILAESKLNEVTNETADTHSLYESNSDIEIASDDENKNLVLKNKWCVCDKTTNDNDKKMCESPKCGQWYHLSCLGYSKDAISKMNSNKETVHSEKFICPVCKGEQDFIEKYKKEIELRTLKYAIIKSSCSSNDDDYEDAEDHGESTDDSESESMPAPSHPASKEPTCSEDIHSSSDESDKIVIKKKRKSKLNISTTSEESISSNEIYSSSNESDTIQTKQKSKAKTSISDSKNSKQHKIKRQKLTSELTEKEQKEKIEKLKNKQKQQNQTKLIENKSLKEKFTKRQISAPAQLNVANKSSKNLSTTFKQTINRTTSIKEQSKIATTSGKVVVPVTKSSSFVQVIDTKKCQYCEGSFSSTKSVPNKIAQETLFSDYSNEELKKNWQDSIYCDDTCIKSYIERELNKRDKSVKEQSNLSNNDLIKNHICLLPHTNKQKPHYIGTVSKKHDELKKDIYNKISQQPKFFIAEVNYFEHLIINDKISKPNSIVATKIIQNEFKKPSATTSVVQKFASSSSKTNLIPTIQRSVSLASNSKAEPPQSKPMFSLTHRNNCISSLRKAFKFKLDEETEVKIQDDKLESLIIEIESHFHNHFGSDEKSYSNKVRSIVANIRQAQNDFYKRIINGKIKPKDLPTISHDLMLNEEKVKEKEQEKNKEIELLKEHIAEINLSQMNRIRKTHKGIEYVNSEENNYNMNDFETTSNKSSENITAEANSNEVAIENDNASANLLNTLPANENIISSSVSSISKINSAIPSIPIPIFEKNLNTALFPATLSFLKKSTNDSNIQLSKPKDLTDQQNTSNLEKKISEKAKKPVHDPDFESDNDDKQDDEDSNKPQSKNEFSYPNSNKKLFDSRLISGPPSLLSHSIVPSLIENQPTDSILQIVNEKIPRPVQIADTITFFGKKPFPQPPQSVKEKSVISTHEPALPLEKKQIPSLMSLNSIPPIVPITTQITTKPVTVEIKSTTLTPTTSSNLNPIASILTKSTPSEIKSPQSSFQSRTDLSSNHELRSANEVSRNDTNKSVRFFLKSTSEKIICKALSPSLKPDDKYYDNSNREFSLALINRLKTKEMEFTLKNSYPIGNANNPNFWHYICKLKKDYSVPVVFFTMHSNGNGVNCLQYDALDSTQFIKVLDEDAFTRFKNNLLTANTKYYDYKIPEEIKDLVGLFHVVLVKGVQSKEIVIKQKWYQENLSIHLDRSKDQILGMFIDVKSQIQHSLKPEFLDSPLAQFIFQEKLKPTDQTDSNESLKVKNKLADNSPEQYDKPILDTTVKLNQMNSKTTNNTTDKNQNQKSDTSAKIFATLINSQKDPRLNRHLSKPNNSEAKKSATESSDVLPPSLPQTNTLSPSIQSPTEVHLFNVAPDIDFTSDDYLINTPAKNIIQNDPIEPSFVNILNENFVNPSQMSNNTAGILFESSVNTCSNKDKNNNLPEPNQSPLLAEEAKNDKKETVSDVTSLGIKLPPSRLWHGNSKEAFENAIQLNKEYAKHKNIAKFTFRNDDWDKLDEKSFNVKNPGMI